jgi:hypothetical protein
MGLKGGSVGLQYFEHTCFKYFNISKSFSFY